MIQAAYCPDRGTYWHEAMAEAVKDKERLEIFQMTVSTLCELYAQFARDPFEGVLETSREIAPMAANDLFEPDEYRAFIKGLWDRREEFQKRSAFAAFFSESVARAKLDRLADH